MLNKYLKQVFNFKDGYFIAVLLIIGMFSIVSVLFFDHMIKEIVFQISIFLLGISIGLITGIGQRRFWYGIIYIYICLVIVCVIIPIAQSPGSIEHLFTTHGYFYWTNIFMVISTKYYLVVHFITKYSVIGLSAWHKKVI